MKVIISGGGTAGHLYPGLALAETLRSTEEAADILFVGTKKGLESKVIPESGYAFKAIEVLGFKRKLSISSIKAFFCLISGVIRSLLIVNEFKPDVVVGLGGYVCVPVVAVSAFKKIPVLIHEQNAVPGLANRLLSRKADVVAVSFSSSEDFFSHAKKVVLTGNPVRAEILNSKKSEYGKFDLDPARKTLFIFGGSRGAERINQAAIDAYPLFKGEDSLQIIHSTGKMNFGRVTAEMDRIRSCDDKLVYRCYPYLDQIGLAYSVSDLVVCRAGATTLAEITALGKAAILVPYPYATEDHQKKNGEILEKAGAAKLISDDELDGPRLFQEVTKVMFDSKLLKKMGEASQGLSCPDAAKRMLNLVLEIARSRE
jgi:UDP-N-acetylglucosamine--N-acetylmuramyl-(pentapeptide) pyrophosphoryl-undecaprenol N-acetylglucosamine transferase